ncbi:iron complex outermembrane receptor protein [Sphingobium sp. B11D3B]|uniref:TonB-dependent receptor n=1 Tax=Sphingobium sp. B11D3B TaxID=2940575 RepID=UPI0022279DCC|nr:TonB-dependent receptor [Sphingobium sp. B11D3B]MCW2389252.1 iron complex outermembrane receptor protein [Sphingobium sp. B11D3B]
MKTMSIWQINGATWLRNSVAVGAMAIACAAPAFAQEAAPSTAPVNQAEPTAQAEDGISEIVVTAQFRGQSAQKTPLAITALSAETIAAQGLTTVSDIAAQAPNVVLQPAPAGAGPSVQSFIRGVGQVDFNPAVSPGVGTYIDDVYYGTIAGANFDLVDLDRIEVLRGPQGTLAGQNSIGGSVKLYSKKPTGNGGGFISLSYGSYNNVRVNAAADMTLVPDRLFMRITGVTDHKDGYVTRYDYACTHPGTQVPSFARDANCKLGTEGGKAVAAGRVQLRWVPTDALEVNLAADYVSDKSEGTPQTLLYARNDSLTPKNSINGVSVGTATGASQFISYSPFGAFAGDSFSTSPYTNYATYCDPTPSSRSGAYCLDSSSATKGGGVSLTIDYKLADNVSFKSITAYRKQKMEFSQDNDATPVPLAQSFNALTYREVTQELRVNASLMQDAVNLTLGGFFMDEFTALDSRIDIPPFDFIGRDRVPAKTYAAFGNVDWSVTDNLQLIGGLRYSKQEKTFKFGRLGVPGTQLGGHPDGPPYLPCPEAGGTIVNVAVCPVNGASGTFKGDNVDYRIAAQYQWTPTIMTYASVATGFKGGGVNPRPYNIYQVIPFAPEKLTSYEVGFKSDLFDRKLRVNGSFFYGNYTDLQLPVSACPANPAYPDVPLASYAQPCSALLNVGKAVTKGGELELTARPTSNLTLQAAVGYINIGFKSLQATAISAGTTLDSKFPLISDWKGSASAQYRIDTANFGTLTPRLDMTFQSSFQTSIPNTTFNKVPAYTLLNAGLTWDAPGGDWQVIANVMNLTNKLYYYAYLDNRATNGTVNGFPAAPRQWRLTVKRSF